MLYHISYMWNPKYDTDELICETNRRTDPENRLPCCCTRDPFLETTAAAAAAKSLQSCPTLCDPIDGSPPDFAIPGILQAKTLEWVTIAFSNA